MPALLPPPLAVAPVDSLALVPVGKVTDAAYASLEKKQEVIPTSTAVVGVIRPPPDIRSIVDKTAQFVARNGPEFEKRILANEKNNVKFNFLVTTDPYHAYYEHRVKEFREQLQGAGVAVKVPDAPSATPLTTANDDEAKAAPGQKVLVPPEQEQYTVRLPEGLTGLDLDVIKLTAQFVARNGKAFLAGLTSREHMNHQFYFLKPTHSMFTFFTSLADAYSKVLMPPKGLLDRLRKDASSKSFVLERCFQRLEWEKSQERARQKAEDEAEAERMQMALIDWHDFVVVETIEFAEGEDEELPQPTTLEEVIRKSRALGEEEEEEEPAAAPAQEAKEAEEVEMDEEELDMVQKGLEAATLAEDAEAQEEMDMEEDEEEEEEQEEEEEEEEEAGVPDEDDRPRKIVKDWKRPEERVPEQHDPTKYVVSPITGELVPVADMAEHIRISLIDPKYKEQKERVMAKLRETTLAADDEISRNMVQLAKTRPDIFGTTEEEVSNAVAAEVEKSAKNPGEKIIWDGHVGSISRTATAAVQQSQTHKDDADALDARPVAGPAAAPQGPKLNPAPPRPAPPNLAINVLRPAGPRPIGVAPPPPARPPQLPMRSSMPRVQPILAASVTPSPVRPAMLFAGLQPPPAAATPAQIFQLQRPLVPMAALSALVPPALMTMAPPPPPREGAPPLAPPEEPEPKRPRLEEVQLLQEAVWLGRYPGPATVLVSVPASGEETSSAAGQTVDVQVSSLSETVGTVKAKLADMVGVPVSKQKITAKAGFLKDGFSLAYYNIGPGEVLSLSLKERGGRKK